MLLMTTTALEPSALHDPLPLWSPFGMAALAGLTAGALRG
jgi:hypothetical protein